MANKTQVTLTITFALCLLATGIPYWLIPYAQATLPNSLIGFGLIAVGVAPLWLCFSSRASLKHAALAAGLGPVGAVLLRIVLGVTCSVSSDQ